MHSLHYNGRNTVLQVIYFIFFILFLNKIPNFYINDKI
ncbi:MAG: hypothetical protein RHS_5593 [Robinsoniella sp. RHS]|nr:MAG: hypothetical protein RHS_5593 [Robinsoniella sp. RHS]